MKLNIKFTLRKKLTLLLVSLTTIMLIIYGWLAMSDFSEDKIAYVYSSLKAHSTSTASQIRAELDLVTNKVNFFLRGYDYSTNKFHQYTKYNLRSDSRIEGIWSYAVSAETAELNPQDTILRDELSATLINEIDEVKDDLVKEALMSKISLRVLQSGVGKWLFAQHFQASGEAGGQGVAVALVDRSYFVENIVASDLSDTFLVDREGKVVVGPQEPYYIQASSDVGDLYLQAQKKNSGKSGTFELMGKDSKEWLASVMDIGKGGLKIVALSSKEVATGAIRVFRIKSLFFLIILVCLTVILAVLGSYKLTQTLKSLLESTRKVASGDFSIESEVDSNDEVGELADGFNTMTVEIRRLLDETREKARMESELITAQTVQATLFPELNYSDDAIEIRSYYQPASECGGDWFTYDHKGEKTYMMIGDATGHGVPAALVTAAAKSASRVIEEFPEISLSQVVGFLNRAICETAKGRVMMTFFIGCYDNGTSEFRYINASHDPPFLIPKSVEKLKKTHIMPLMGESNPRLGESLNSKYHEEVRLMMPDEKVVFYTDGVTELMNEEREMWGERRFVKTLLNSFNQKASIEKAMEDLAVNISEHQKSAVLDDDLTYFMFHKKDEGAPAQESGSV